MAEKTPNQQLAEKLLFKPAYVGVLYPDGRIGGRQNFILFFERFFGCVR